MDSKFYYRGTAGPFIFVRDRADGEPGIEIGVSDQKDVVIQFNEAHTHFLKTTLQIVDHGPQQSPN